jgi:hypothetical protein
VVEVAPNALIEVAAELFAMLFYSLLVFTSS